MALREAVKVVGDVLKAELEMDAGQIVLKNQKWNIPNNTKLYIVLGYVGPGKVIANKNESISNGDDPNAGMTEQQSIVMGYLIQIDLMAFSKADGTNQARERKEEVLMALRSLAGEKAAEVNNLQLARNPAPFMDVSDLEETEMLERYTTTIFVTAMQTKEKAVVEYYSTFNAPEVTVNE